MKTFQSCIFVRPIIVSDLNQKGQVDLVYIQSLPGGEYIFILHDQENLTKLSFFRLLTSKRAADMEKELPSIFLNFGTPHV